MPLSENVAGTWKALLFFENVSGSWLPIVLWENISGVWTLISGTLGLTASDAIGNSSNSTGSALVTSSTPGTTPSNGISPYTYSWAFQSGSASPVCSGSTAQNPTWSATIGASNDSSTTDSAVWRCTVTDGASQVAHVDINVSLTYTNTHP